MSKDRNELIEVELLKTHEHGEVEYGVGAKIKVLPHEKQWLIGAEVIANDSANKTKE